MLEEQQIGTILTKLQATDADSNIDEYKLEPNDYFEINPTTGEISLFYLILKMRINIVILCQL